MTNTIFHASAVGLLMLALAGCEDNAGPGTSPADVAQGEKPAGSTVTVSGEIAHRYDDNTFSLGDEEWGQNLVIVTKQPLPATVGEDDVLQVTGTVRQIGIVEFEQEYDWEFDPQIETELEDVENYLYADTYTILGDEDALEEQEEEQQE